MLGAGRRMVHEMVVWCYQVQEVMSIVLMENWKYSILLQRHQDALATSGKYKVGGLLAKHG
jgi:hypothetical protein